MASCPYCGRRLRETERYCWFCEADVSKVIDEEERPVVVAVHKEQSDLYIVIGRDAESKKWIQKRIFLCLVFLHLVLVVPFVPGSGWNCSYYRMVRYPGDNAPGNFTRDQKK